MDFITISEQNLSFGLSQLIMAKAIVIQFIHQLRDTVAVGWLIISLPTPPLYERLHLALNQKMIARSNDAHLYNPHMPLWKKYINIQTHSDGVML